MKKEHFSAHAKGDPTIASSKIIRCGVESPILGPITFCLQEDCTQMTALVLTHLQTLLKTEVDQNSPNPLSLFPSKEQQVSWNYLFTLENQ